MDPIPPPEPPRWPVETINAMLGRLHRLRQEIAAYGRLQDAEIERLKQRAEEIVGPLARRADRIEDIVRQFGVAAYRIDADVIKHRLPNGDILSTAVQTKISIIDEQALGNLLAEHGSFPDEGLEWRAWVSVKHLRAWLDALVAVGHLLRVIRSDDDFIVVDEIEGWNRPLPDGDYRGVWMWTVEAEAALNVHAGEIIPGVTWTPNGTMGVGRNFRIVV